MTGIKVRNRVPRDVDVVGGKNKLFRGKGLIRIGRDRCVSRARERAELMRNPHSPHIHATTTTRSAK